MNTYQSLCRAFSSRERPDHFIDSKHCEECSEHEATLASKDIDSISFMDVGNIAYSPIGFISVEGFLYYLPGLARLITGTGEEYFLDNFLIYLENEQRRNALNQKEKKALADYLIELKSVIPDSIQDNLDGEDLDELIEWLNVEQVSEN